MMSGADKMMSPTSAKTTVRLLNFLTTNGVAESKTFDDGCPGKIIFLARNSARILIQESALDALHRADLIACDGYKWTITDAGVNRLKRMNAALNKIDDAAFQDQHRDLKQREVSISGATQSVRVNVNESPLSRLRARKMASGQPWISDVAFDAGERIRRDFTQGQLMQKVTSSWDPTSASNKSRGGAGGKVDLMDGALDARARVEKAVEFLGPDLSSVITDVCCYLKGLESVERERQWPPRSAKLMLRTGLELLARFYTLGQGGSANGSKIRAWGAEGFRPSIKY